MKKETIREKYREFVRICEEEYERTKDWKRVEGLYEEKIAKGWMTEKGDWREYMEEARGLLQVLKFLINTGEINNEILLEELEWIKERVEELKQKTTNEELIKKCENLDRKINRTIQIAEKLQRKNKG